MVKAWKDGPSLGRASPGADPARSRTPAPRAPETLLWGMSVSCHPASRSLYLRGGSAFSKPVVSTHHKQQRTASLRCRLSPCDKCASSVVQRFADTLPWALILLLLLPSPTRTEHQALECPSPRSYNNPSRPVMLKIEPWFRGAVGSPCKHPNVLKSRAR